MIDAFTIEARARRLVERCGTRDPLRIAQAERILLYERKLGKLLGFYTCIQRHRVIVLNQDLPEEQRTIVLAHELGHDALHRARAREAALHEFALFDMKDPSEYEANAFAAQLLIDTEELYDYVRLYRSDYAAVSSHFHCSIDLTLTKIAELRRCGQGELILPELPDAHFLKKAF